MTSKVQRHLSYLLMDKTLKDVKFVDGLFKYKLKWVYVHQVKLRLLVQRKNFITQL